MVLEVEGLKKMFGRRAALAGVDMTVEAGEVVGLFGPTGAGKSTLLRVCAGVIEPTAGRARVFKIDVALDRRRAQERLGYIPASASIDPDLSPWSYLRFLAAVRGFAEGPARHAVRDAAGEAGLDTEILREGRRLGALERRQVALAAALIGDPVLLLLDDPFADLDEGDAMRFAERISGVATPERGVLLTGSVRAPLDRVARRVIALEAGKVRSASTAPPQSQPSAHAETTA